MRKIIHVDMDAFYASVEQRDDPALRNRPVSVGGSPKGRGVVMAASYEARQFGVRSAMPAAKALRLCPDLVFVKPRFDAYQEVSVQVRDIFRRYSDLVEPLSLDEAYLDVTNCEIENGSATLIARAIKRDIFAETDLTASAGVSINKFLAKVASGMNKPDGLTLVRPEDAEAFIADLPIERFYGVGKATASRMRARGIANGADLRAQTERQLVEWFGKAGAYYFRIARAQDDRPVRVHRRRKSVGAERTFFDDVSRYDQMLERLSDIAAKVWDRMERAEVTGTTVTLKIKYHDFVIRTRRTTLLQPLDSEEELFNVIERLLHRPAPPQRPVRLLGISVSNLSDADDPTRTRQLHLTFDESGSRHS